jgi:hypothetical protein
MKKFFGLFVLLLAFGALAANSSFPTVNTVGKNFRYVTQTQISLSGYDTIKDVADSSTFVSKLDMTKAPYNGCTVDLWLGALGGTTDSASYLIQIEPFNATGYSLGKYNIDTIAVVTPNAFRLPLEKYPAAFYKVWIHGYTGNDKSTGFYINQVWLVVSKKD